jgi:hypothetical protein
MLSFSVMRDGSIERRSFGKPGLPGSAAQVECGNTKAGIPVSRDRRILLLAWAGGAAVSGSGCATDSTSTADAERLIAESSRQWTGCFASGDTSVMERILATEFVNTSPRGDRSNKLESIAAARRGPDWLVSAELAEITVKVFGTTAIAFGGDHLKLRSATPAEVRTAWTDTWLLRGGSWQVIASHECVMRSGAV